MDTKKEKKGRKTKRKMEKAGKPFTPAKDFRDAEYPEVEYTKDLKQAIMDGIVQVLNTPRPLLFRVSELRMRDVYINGQLLVKKKIYKAIGG